ncbi:DUF4097 family beta strand repeat protein [candidate division KSB1 bacterium]|nr:DUF4097 family beta strand repeat protein [candidate division KSB1 bacterium]
MRNNSIVVTLIVIVFSCVTFAGTITKKFEKTLQLHANGKVKIKNVNGEIFVESWDSEKVEIFADIEVKAANSRDAERFLDKVNIKIDRNADEIYIRPDYPNEDEKGFLDSIFGHKKPSVRVDFSIKVPEDAKIDLNSVNGSVQVVNIGGPAELSTVNGKVVAKQMRSTVEAKTTNGGINVEFDDLQFTDNMFFHTVNGSINLYVPRNISADVDISTVNGGLHTDFPLTVQGKWGPKSIKGTLNGGGKCINLKTVNGSVSLFER